MLTSIAIVAAIFLMVPLHILKRLIGYRIAFDVVSSWYIVSTYASAGAASGLTVAVFAALILSLSIRVLRMTIGYETYLLNGDARIDKIIAALLTQGMKWTRASIASLIKGKPVTAPEPLNGSWVHSRDPMPSIL